MDERIDVKPKNKRCEKAEVQLRIQTVAEMLAKGLSNAEILRIIQSTDTKAQGWSLSQDRAYVYLRLAKRVLRENANDKVPDLIALAVTRYTDLYKRNYQIQDFRECRQIQDSLNKLLGLTIEQQNNITLNQQNNIITNNNADFIIITDAKAIQE
jgi:hypothetical protein